MSFSITPQKLIAAEQLAVLLKHLKDRRDLAIARGKPVIDIKRFYAVRLLIECGLRNFEFCALKEGDLIGNRLTVQRGKGGKVRTVPLTRVGANLFREWLTVKPQIGYRVGLEEPFFPNRHHRHYNTRGLRRIVKESFLAAGLPKRFSTHATRHLYATLLLEAGVPLHLVRDLLGHADISTTSKYLHALGKLDVDDLMAPNVRKEDKADVEQKPKPSNRNLLDLIETKRTQKS